MQHVPSDIVLGGVEEQLAPEDASIIHENGWVADLRVSRTVLRTVLSDTRHTDLGTNLLRTCLDLLVVGNVADVGTYVVCRSADFLSPLVHTILYGIFRQDEIQDDDCDVP
jgi:hypothetical protein